MYLFTLKMPTPQQKAFRMFAFMKTNATVTMQSALRTGLSIDLPHCENILQWVGQFKKSGRLRT